MSPLNPSLISRLVLLITAVCLSILPDQSKAYLGGFETTDGYSNHDVGTALNMAPLFGSPATFVGPDVNLYDAGQKGSVDIADNTGLWSNVYGAGTSGRYQLWNASSDADATYLVAHTNYYSGGQCLAIRASESIVTNAAARYGRTGAFDSQWTYTVDSKDLNNYSPTGLSGNVVSLQFQLSVGAQYKQPIQGGGRLSMVDNNVVMLSVGLGGSAAAKAIQIGFDDLQHVRYLDDVGTWVDTGIISSYVSFDTVFARMDMVSQTYDLQYYSSLTGITSSLVTGLHFNNNIGGSFGNITLTTMADPENPTNGFAAHGLAKTYLDNFSFSVVPEPSSILLALSGALLICMRRRH